MLKMFSEKSENEPKKPEDLSQAIRDNISI